jgi:hypothetical protein
LFWLNDGLKFMWSVLTLNHQTITS